MTSHTNIPVKWMAVESLMSGFFHGPSDVWSFGVTLWEMFTFGESPYLEGCEDYFRAEQSEEKLKEQMNSWIQKLNEGFRFLKPEACPARLYSDVMLRCWINNFNLRPDFVLLQRLLKQIEKEVT